jgi:hypothetical protein
MPVGSMVYAIAFNIDTLLVAMAGSGSPARRKDEMKRTKLWWSMLTKEERKKTT